MKRSRFMRSSGSRAVVFEMGVRNEEYGFSHMDSTPAGAKGLPDYGTGFYCRIDGGWQAKNPARLRAGEVLGGFLKCSGVTNRH